MYECNVCCVHVCGTPRMSYLEGTPVRVDVYPPRARGALLREPLREPLLPSFKL